ncbi:MAG: Fic family protein [Cyanobacteria bacterium J06623_4]
MYPPHYLLNELMDDFIHWLSTTLANSHPLNYACEAHYRFVSIHPFADDNGRTGRLLMNLLLLRAGFPIVSISHQQREAYIQALVLAQQEHNQKEGSQKEQQPLTDLGICQQITSWSPHPSPLPEGEGIGFKVPLPQGEGFRVRAAVMLRAGTLFICASLTHANPTSSA